MVPRVAALAALALTLPAPLRAALPCRCAAARPPRCDGTAAKHRITVRIDLAVVDRTVEVVT